MSRAKSRDSKRKMSRTQKSVIPAKAGIHYPTVSWIPASAGMTGGRNSDLGLSDFGPRTSDP